MTSKVLTSALAASLIVGCWMSARAEAGIAVRSQAQQSRYAVVNLGTFGGTSSSANTVNALGWASGSANAQGDQTAQAALWRDAGKLVTPLGTLGGPNSAVLWPNHNERGELAGVSETADPNPLNENWSCAFFFPTTTHQICLGFVWRNGHMTALSTLGGYDGFAAGTNNLDQVVGWAETTLHDLTCTAPQVLQFEPVWWGPSGRIRALPTFPGDPDGAATATNDRGQIVGISGMCDQAAGRFSAIHALLWRRDTVTNLGTLGGGAWNTPTDLNERGEIVGFSDFPGDQSGGLNAHAVRWTKSADGRFCKKMGAWPACDLGALQGDSLSLANGINDRGQIVGQSLGASTSRAFIWEGGAMTDLNTLIPSDSGLYLLSAAGINDRGAIVGEALVTSDGTTTAFEAIPAHADARFGVATTDDVRRVAPVKLPKGVRAQLLRRFGIVR